MKYAKMRIIGSLCLGLGAIGYAHALEPVTNALSVHRVVVESNGHERLESAATAKPGDLLEYVVEFHNNGPSAVKGLAATLPLPAGTEFVMGSEAPMRPEASLDGNRFESLPLKRRVTRADGAVTEELVPAREYRYLRWSPADLAANGTLTVRARVMVAPAVALAAAGK